MFLDKNKIFRRLRLMRNEREHMLFNAPLPEVISALCAELFEFKHRNLFRFRRRNSYSETELCLYVVFISDRSSGKLNAGDGINVVPKRKSTEMPLDPNDPRGANAAFIVDRDGYIKAIITPGCEFTDAYSVGFGYYNSNTVTKYRVGDRVPEDFAVDVIFYSDSAVLSFVKESEMVICDACGHSLDEHPPEGDETTEVVLRSEATTRKIVGEIDNRFVRVEKAVRRPCANPTCDCEQFIAPHT